MKEIGMDFDAMMQDTKQAKVPEEAKTTFKIEEELTYYDSRLLIDDIAKKIQSETDIDVITKYLELIYDTANVNSLIDDVQEKISFYQWKKEVESGKVIPFEGIEDEDDDGDGFLYIDR